MNENRRKNIIKTLIWTYFKYLELKSINIVGANSHLEHAKQLAKLLVN